MNISPYSQKYAYMARQFATAASGETVRAENAAAIIAAATVSSAAPAEAPQTSLEDYKREFYGKIDAMPIHPSQAGTRQSISIAPELFDKMRNDPELEQKVLTQIEADLAANYVVSPAFATMRFDADGEYSGSAGGSAYMGEFEKEASDAFWRREPSGKAQDLKALDEKRAEEKRREKKLQERQQMEELLNSLAEQRRASVRSMQDYTAGVTEYMRGPQTIIRPSIIESLG